LKIACFITSHGFGHATRTLALISKLAKTSSFEISIFSTLPDWFFHENLDSIPFQTIHLKTDVGLVQKTPFEHDLNSTLDQLYSFLQFENNKRIITLLEKGEFDFIFCDISPLGLHLSKKLGIPSCLLENFTWDWIYEEYLTRNNNFKKPIEQLKGIFQSANLHIQTTPICNPVQNAHPINPIFRPAKKDGMAIRKSLGIKEEEQVILVTTGGIPQKYSFINKIKEDHNRFYILTGAFSEYERGSNFCLLPHKSAHYFPDLIQSADGIVGKVGYGTVAEVWAAQKPFIAVFRENFRESQPMRNFINQNISGFEISDQTFHKGDWIDEVGSFLEINENKRVISPVNGSDQAVQLITEWLDHKRVA
jgi:UDP-N-acetylglucosamine:LPS N-acetylglucosamine transferase